MGEVALVTPAQIRGARALLDWSQAQLAKAARVSLTTVRDYEKERRGWREEGQGIDQVQGGLEAIRRALEDQGVSFLPSEDVYGPGIRTIAKVPNVLRWPTKLGKLDPLLVPVEWRGRKFNVFVSCELLGILGGNLPSFQPSAEYLRIYEEHRSDILKAAADAIDAGRVTPDGRVHLIDSDLPQHR